MIPRALIEVSKLPKALKESNSVPKALVDALARPKTVDVLEAIKSVTKLSANIDKDSPDIKLIQILNQKLIVILACNFSHIANESFKKFKLSELDNWPNCPDYKGIGEVWNKISTFVIHDILSNAKPKRRLITIERYLQIAERLIARGDYFSAEAIYCALISPQVRRATAETYHGMGEKSVAAIKSLKSKLKEASKTKGPKLSFFCPAIGNSKAYLEGSLDQSSLSASQKKEIEQNDKEVCERAYREGYENYNTRITYEQLSSSFVVWLTEKSPSAKFVELSIEIDRVCQIRRKLETKRALLKVKDTDTAADKHSKTQQQAILTDEITCLTFEIEKLKSERQAFNNSIFSLASKYEKKILKSQEEGKEVGQTYSKQVAPPQASPQPSPQTPLRRVTFEEPSSPANSHASSSSDSNPSSSPSSTRERSQSDSLVLEQPIYLRIKSGSSLFGIPTSRVIEDKKKDEKKEEKPTLNNIFNN